MKKSSKKSLSRIFVSLFLITYSLLPPVASIYQLIGLSTKGTFVAMAQAPSPVVEEPITQIGMCIEDAANSPLNCTANDVDISHVTNVKILDDGCKHIDDSVTFEATWELLPTATKRYDMGLYFATQGQSNARRGQCSVSTLPNSPVPPWFNYDLDSCGDIGSSSSVNPKITLTVQCLDPDGDNFLNVPYCTSWNQKSSIICNGPSDAIPGNKAKCNCPSGGITVPITVPYSAYIEVIKEVIPADDTGTFELYVDDNKTPSCVGDGGSTGIITVGAGTSDNPGDTHIVGEDAAICGTNPSDYTSLITCVDRGTQSFDGGSPLISNSSGPLIIDVDKDDDVVCTITNSLTTGTVIVHKDVVGPHGEDFYDTSTFSFSLDGNSPQTIGDDGEIIITGVVAGPHTITESPLSAGYTLSSLSPDSDGDLSNGAQFLLEIGGTKDIYIVNTKNIPSIYGHKYNDVDGNGSYDSSIDTPLANWTIFIDTNGNGVLDIEENRTNTNTQGEYSFLGVTPGLNEVCEVNQTGWVKSYPTGCHQVTVGVYDAVEGVDFLNYESPTLTVVKEVINNDGGDATVNDFEIKIGNDLLNFGSGVVNGDKTTFISTPLVLADVSYYLSEKDLFGYDEGSWECKDEAGVIVDDNPVILNPRQDITCTITNDDIAPTLTLKKEINNENGGTKGAADWVLYADGSERPFYNWGPIVGPNQVMAEVEYTLTETLSTDYQPSGWVCTGGGVQVGNKITLDLGENATCTITNDDIQPLLTITKIVEGGTKSVSDFILSVDSTLVTRLVTSGIQNGFNAGTYTVSETPDSDYTAVISGACEGNGSISLTAGDVEECTITNTRDTGNLQVKKTIDYGSITDWWFSLDGGDPVQMDSSGLIDFGQVTTNEDHIIIESGPFGTFSLNSITGTNCTPNIGNKSATATVTKDATTTCTFSNLVNKGSITIIKDSIPNDGQDFSFLATGNGVSNFLFLLDDDGDDDTTLNNTRTFSSLFPGSYTINELSTPGWDFNKVECISNQSGGTLTYDNIVSLDLDPGENIECKFTNTKKGHIIVEKQVLPDGHAQKFDFAGELTGTIGDEEQISKQVIPGTYTVSEDLASLEYRLTNISCDDSNSVGDINTGITTFEVEPGEIVKCTYTNEAIPPTLRLVKVVDFGDPRDWTLTAIGTNGFSDSGDSTIFHTVNANTPYTLSESTLQEGYSQFGSWSCDGGILEGTILTLGLAQNVTCTITNHRDTGSVKVNKRIDIDGDGIFEKGNIYANSHGFRWILDGRQLPFGTRINNLYTTTSNYSHTFDEIMPNGYHFVSWYKTNEPGRSCLRPNGTKLPDEILVRKNRLTEITLCNARDTGTITIIKDSINDSWEDFYFDTNFPSRDFRLADDGYNHIGLPKERTFTVPTGTYYVDERDESGWKLTNLQCKGDGNFKINLEAGRVNIKIGYGENVTCKYTNTKLARVWGFKYNDKNANGRWNLKEYGLGNWRIFIDENHNNTYDITEPTTLTRNHSLMLGYYQFNNLLPDTYSICEQLQTTWTNTTPLCRTVRLTPGDIDGFINFGNIQYGSILVHKFEDMNGNGTIDANERGLEDWEIGIYQGDDCQGQVINNGSEDTDDHGDAQFDDIIPGHYSVMETPQDGWITTSPVCQNIIVNPAQTKSVNIGNFEKGDMSVWKYEDTDGILGRTDGEEFYIGNPTFTFRVYKDDTGTWEFIRESDTNESGEAVFTNVFETVGNYYVCEVEKDGWENMRSLYNPSNNLSERADEYPVCEGITVSASGYNVSTEFGNAKLTDIHGYKWSDFNGNGVRDCIEEGEEIEEVVGLEVARGVINRCELEPLLSGWTINLFKWNGEGYDFNPFKTMLTDNSTEHYGWYWFEDLMPGKYKICEVQQDGWTQTSPSNDNENCHEITLPISPLLDQGQSLNSILGPQYDFGNTINPELEISKSNDSDVLGMYGGGSVVYTITVTTPEIIEDMGIYTLKNVKVRDIMPSGFIYQTGTWTAISSTRGDLTTGITTQPTYESNLPATWTLGDMIEGETVTLTYTTKISLLQDPGLYKDIAWTKGSSILGEQVLGNTDSGIFVGTEVKVIEPIEIEEGEVLGASTTITLPRTGANTYLTLGALISMILGLILLAFNPMKKINTLIIAGILLFGISTALKPTPTYASTDSLMIKIEEPQSPTKDDTFNIGFVVLDLEERELEIQCFETTYGTFGPTYTTNSGNCVVDSSIVEKSGTYQFYIETTAGVDVKESEKVTVVVDLEKPLAVTEYEKTEDTCTYILTFKTADDGRTSKIQIFRSDTPSFTANNTTLIHELTVTPNQEVTYTDTSITECDKTYYYAVRAVDDIGNLSPITTEDIVITLYEITPSTTEDGETQGADSTPADTTTEDSETTEGEDTENGEVKGEEEEISTTEDSFWDKYRDQIITIGVVLLASIGYIYVRRKRQ